MAAIKAASAGSFSFLVLFLVLGQLVMCTGKNENDYENENDEIDAAGHEVNGTGTHSLALSHG